MKTQKKYYNTLEDLFKDYPKKELTGREKNWSKEKPINNLQFLYRINFPSQEPYWAAQCLCCKKFSYYRASHIAKGNIRCCANNIKIGDTIGKLTILSIKERFPRKIWNCQCECGNFVQIREDTLLKKNTFSCGCYNKEHNLFTAKDYSGIETEHYLIKTRTNNKSPNNGAYLWEVECKKCHKTYLALPTEILRKKWNPCYECWHTSSKGEEKIQKILTNNNISYIQEYHLFNYSDTKRPCKVDFYIDNSNGDNYIIEYDGIQHFQLGWDMSEEDFNYRRMHDLEKDIFCFNNHIPIIRIPFYFYDNITLNTLMLETSQFLLTKEKEKDYFKNKQ